MIDQIVLDYLNQVLGYLDGVTTDRRHPILDKASFVHGYMNNLPKAPRPDWSQAPKDAISARIEPIMHFHASPETRFQWVWYISPGVRELGQIVDVPLGFDFRTAVHERPEVSDE